MGGAAETLGKRFAVMRPHLNEFQRRLWLGAEAAELGPGGVAVVAAATGVAADTVRRGRAEAGAAEFPATGARAGRAVGASWPRRTMGSWSRRWRRWSTRWPAVTRCRRCAGRPSRPGRWPGR